MKKCSLSKILRKKATIVLKMASAKSKTHLDIVEFKGCLQLDKIETFLISCALTALIEKVE